MPDVGTWAEAIRVETTARETYDREAGLRRRPVVFKPDRAIDSKDTWMFTDGSSSGWQGLVVLTGENARLVARQTPTVTRNVGAEMDALLLALEAIVPGERVAIVADFLWSIYYVLGWHQTKNVALHEQVDRARVLLDQRRPALLRYIHVRGHTNDGSAFGCWNHIADRLCAAAQRIDLSLPRSTFEGRVVTAREVATILSGAVSSGTPASPQSTSAVRGSRKRRSPSDTAPGSE